MAATIAAPLIWPASDVWLGQDGNWSTFQMTAGFPPQLFYVLPSTTNSISWIPGLEACAYTTSRLSDCAISRGIGESEGRQSLGFQPNASKTWDQIGLYALASEQNLYGPNEYGLYGLEQMTLGSSDTNITAGDQVVAAIASADFWLGSVGLANELSSFSVVHGNKASLIGSMAQLNDIPSVSYGYTAGASYRSSSADLVLGGYDQGAIDVGHSIRIDIQSGSDLLVNLASIITSDSLLGTASMLVSTTGLTMKVDTTVSQLWLPTNVCNRFAESFGLLYDESANLYLINDTMRKALQSWNPQVTFTLATAPSSTVTTNIVFPYAAFDLSIGLPTYNSTRRYFPLRRASNETQYVLGRAFMQEAYIVVDWERGNFSIGQALHSNETSRDVIAVVSLGKTGTASPSGIMSSAGAVAGLVIGILGAVVFASLLWYRCKRRHRRSQIHEVAAQEQSYQHFCDNKRRDESPVELQGTCGLSEAMSESLHELDQDHSIKPQLMSSVVYELPGHSVSQELAAHDDCQPRRSKRPLKTSL